jgi:hypothetical protein
MTWRSRLSIAAWVGFAIHLIANGTMALILRNGLAVNPDVHSRIEFIASHRALWLAAWLPWTAASLSIFAVIVCFRQAHKTEVQSPQLLQAAIFACLIGMGFDLNGQIYAVTLLPDAAQAALQQLPSAEQHFDSYYKQLIMMSGAAGNLGYTVATLLCAIPTRTLYPRWVNLAAVSVGILGVLETVSCLVDSLLLQIVLNAALFPALSVWLVGVALTAARTPSPTPGE